MDNPTLELNNADKFEIANQIVVLSTTNNGNLTNLKLQKILFFLQAAWLVERHHPLIDAKFSRWKLGPVESDVYHEFNHHGSSVITEPEKIFDLEKFTFVTPELAVDSYPEEDISLLIRYTNNLLAIRTYELVQETHRESIWSDYLPEIEEQVAPNYTEGQIINFFENHQQDRIWNRENR
ncbi:Panacea domain-containing protein [Oenococcus sp.]|uniref:Panacea domain-containing protein n=1 Tax=Oenococcus sp. TaxID=1979414 RepID=UPI0039E812DF